MKMEVLSKIRSGDTIVIDDIEGVVVFSSISDTYSEKFPKPDWSGNNYDGIMIQQENGALIFHDTEYLQTDYSRIERL